MGLFSGDKSYSNSYSGLRGLGGFGGDQTLTGLVGNIGNSTNYLFPALQNRASNPFSMSLDSNGFFAGPGGSSPVSNAFNEAVKQGFGLASAGLGQRGMVSPENLAAVAGSAAQNVLPQFIPAISQNAYQAQLMPEQVAQNRFDQLLQALGQASGLLGSESHQSYTGQNPFGSALGSALGSGLGSGITSWLGGAASRTGNLFGGGSGGFNPTQYPMAIGPGMM